MIILYSTGCPKCKTLKDVLKRKGVEYVEENDVETMLNKGLSDVPWLEVDGQMMNFDQSLDWLKNK